VTLLSYCAQLVRDQAPDRYLATLFAPSAARPALFGLYAFDHEITKVRHVVSQPIAGLIRFQWWRDALDAIAEGRPAPAHPIAEALQDAWRRFQISRARLDAAIDARERELGDDPPATLEQLEQHLEATSSSMVLAALDILCAGDERTIDAGRRVGLAIGLADLLREIDLRRERALFLPKDLLDRHGIAPTTLTQATTSQAFAPVIRELAGRARDHLRHARRHRRMIPKRALPALLPGTLVGDRLERLYSLGGRTDGRSPAPPLAPLKLLGYRALGIF
jgi:NADH dehydrogenase [ubiquinone] 1 alpha subcomplex assembly factor 6